MARAVIGGIILGLIAFGVVCFSTGDMIYVAAVGITIAIFAAILVIVEWLSKKINW